MYIRPYSSQILMKLAISREEQHSNIKIKKKKIRPMGVQLFHADGETRRSFRNFADAPHKCAFLAVLFSWCTEV